MSFAKALRTGAHGIRLELPATLVVRGEQGDTLELYDSDSTRWDVSYFRGLHLDLAETHRADLARSFECYARAMFDEAFAANRDDASKDSTPRTADPTWSPMVDVEHLAIGGAPAVRTVHRMMYQPGREIVMGHLLVPLRHGLFEGRVLSMAGTTGYRESTLMLTMAKDAEPAFPPQTFYDDPRHDPSYPKHPLSRVRAALRTLQEDAGMRILEPAEPISWGEVALPALACALVPPPRFVLDARGKRNAEQATFTRCSFCGTDGNESLLVNAERHRGRLEHRELRRFAQETSRRVHVEAQVEDIVLNVEDLEAVDGRPHVLVVTECRGHQGRLRNCARFFVDDAGRPWSIWITSTAAVPAAVRAEELDAAARSWRRTSDTSAPASKPWWKFF